VSLFLFEKKSPVQNKSSFLFDIFNIFERTKNQNKKKLVK